MSKNIFKAGEAIKNAAVAAKESIVHAAESVSGVASEGSNKAKDLVEDVKQKGAETTKKQIDADSEAAGKGAQQLKDKLEGLHDLNDLPKDQVYDAYKKEGKKESNTGSKVSGSEFAEKLVKKTHEEENDPKNL